MPGRDVEVHVLQREGALVVGEVETAHVEVEAARGDVGATLGLGLDGEHLAQADDGADALLKVGQVVDQVADLAHEPGRDQEQGDQRGLRHAAAARDERARDGDAREQHVQHHARAADQPRLDPHDGEQAAVHLGRELSEATQREGAAEARAQVVAGRDGLLEGGGVVGPGHLLLDLELGDDAEARLHDDGHEGAQQREHDPRGPPGEAGDDPHGDDADRDARGRPQVPADHAADGVGVVVDTVEDLARCLLAQHGQRLAQGGREQVGAQAALGAVDHAGPHELPHGVHDGVAHHAGGEQREGGSRGRLGHPAGDDSGERAGDGGEHQAGQGDDGGGRGQAPPVEPTGGIFGDARPRRGA